MWAGCRVMCRDYVIDCNSVTSKQIVSSTLLAMFEPLFLSFCPRIFCEISCCCVTILATTPRVNLALPHSFMQTRASERCVSTKGSNADQGSGRLLRLCWKTCSYILAQCEFSESCLLMDRNNKYMLCFKMICFSLFGKATPEGMPSNEANMWHTFHHTHWYNQL